MYKWYIKIYLDSGTEIYGIYESDLASSTRVCEKLFTGRENTINGIASMSGTNLFFNTSKVVAFEISDKNID
mgnify:CR=1 FL=1